MVHLASGWHEWAISGAILMGALIVARMAHKILFSVGQRLARRTGGVVDNSLVRHGRRPAARAEHPAGRFSLQGAAQRFNNRVGIGRHQR